MTNSDPLSWPTTIAAPVETGARPTPVTSNNQVALSTGTRLDEFEVVDVLGVGGFGIVYRALDHVLKRDVAIKEYMPVAVAMRNGDTKVSARAPSEAQTFALGLESFLNEARLLARFDHHALVKVYRFWRANGTAYMVMPYYRGITLKEARRQMTGSPNGSWLRDIVGPLLGALELLHREGVYHRDIAPDNILVLADGRPVLLDFGSARHVIADRTQHLTAFLKPNFAPIEQYADEASMRQGPWTDLYALGATLHFLLTGQAPTPSVLRAVRDVLPTLSSSDVTCYAELSRAFLLAVDWSLALAPQDRPQTVDSMRRAIEGEVIPSESALRRDRASRTESRPFPVVSPTYSDPQPHPVAGHQPLYESTTELAASLPRSSTAVTLSVAGAISLAFFAWATSWTSSSTGRESTSASQLQAKPTNATGRAMRLVQPATSDAAAPVIDAKVAAPAPPAVSAARSRGGTGSKDRKSVGPPSGSLKDECAGLNFFARSMCRNSACRGVHWREQPYCVEERRIEEARLQRMEH